ncbi:MAG: MBL fold metallo-hydrolase [Gammaproteobacteria bacterium]|nr:MAG: MBL fold metallo-hydrolase [Gammaproteobacteria bacterium]
MLFRQFFDEETWTYTYLLADDSSREALLIDPVVERMPCYRRILQELELQLCYALDTHVHADHVTALGTLRDEYACETLVNDHALMDCASHKLADGEQVQLGKLVFTSIYTPGHTDDSMCLHVRDRGEDYLFTGDTLFIRGSGRTDFQNGDAGHLYDSLQRLLASYPDETWVYPAHDYKGWTRSTLGEERRFNPRLQVPDKGAFIELMDNLDLPNPKYMDVAVPANRSCGRPANKTSD